jgi:hypothetical protein
MSIIQQRQEEWMRLAIIGALIAASACTSANGNESGNGGNSISGGSEGAQTGSAGQRSFDVGAFQSVSLAGAHDVIVTVGGPPSVRAEGDAEALERLEVRVEGGVLRLETRRNSWFSGGSRGSVTVHVTAPSLNGASIGGSGDMRIDRVQAEAFESSISGSGDLEIGTLQARRVEFSVTGSGDIRASGAAEEAEISIAGSGSVELDSLQVRRASVSIAGSGDVAIQASEAVDGSIMGSGNVTVRGPARCSVTKMGSGEIRCGA